MDTNKMREQASNEFEAWLDGYEKDREANGWLPLEPFVRKHMRNAFVASREAVVVGLPAAEFGVSPDIEDDEEYEAAEAISMCEDAVLSRVRKHIEAQGLKVAP
ncbi:hypothetical protein [Pseudomonas sp. p1(2021b)]|uniref:hypothetical protein n=1 Tax=Pseudomonas sp. p1(2021b) TaxID=2874628 RepID=UPI003D28007B